jgi:hypothetical protein
MVTLNTDYARFVVVTTKLLDIHRRSQGLEIEYQKLIAETLILRLFYELDNCVEGVILKLLRGGLYLDGSSPILLRPAFPSQDAARKYILKTNKLYYLEWATLNKVTKNLNGIMDSSDHFLTTRNLYDGTYEDMRFVRNHVAHNTTSTRTKFVAVVKRVYRTPVGISSAKFLLSKRTAVTSYMGSEMVIAQYIRWSKIFIKELTKSPT